MISRRGLGKLLASTAAFLGFKPEIKAEPIVETKKWKSNWPGPRENYEKFVSTPYLDRMDFSDYYPSDIDGNPWGPGHEAFDNMFKGEQRLQKHYEWINGQVLSFRDQIPYKLGIDQRKVRYAAEKGHNGNQVWIKHDDHLRDQIRDAIKQVKGNGVA